MREKTRTILKEGAFVMLLLLGVIALAHAQDDRAQKKVKVQIEITEDGKITTSTQEVEIDPETVEDRMDEMIEEIEMVLQEAVRDLDESDIEVIINKRRAASNAPFAPHYRYAIGSPPRPPMPPAFKADNDRPFLGVVTKAAEDARGARIERVVEGSAAEEAGLQEGDVLLEIDGEKVNDHTSTAEAVRSHKVGDQIALRYTRDGKKMKAKAELRAFEPLRSYDRGRNRAFYGEIPHFEKREEMRERLRDLERKVFLGIEGSSDEESGVTITKVFDSSTASTMGIKVGDQLTHLNEKPIENIGDLVLQLHSFEPGDEVTIGLTRDGEEVELKGQLKPFPEDLRRKYGMDKPRPEMRWHEMFPGPPEDRHVFRFEMRELNPEEIEDLNERSGQTLDASNSLELDHFMVSPNPSDGIFILDGIPADQGDVQIIVLDPNGRVVMEKKTPVGDDGLLQRIDLTGEDAGVYFISIQQNGKGKTTRVVKH